MENTIIVTASYKLSQELQDKLSKKLIAKFGSFPVEFKVDSNLILGFVVKFKDDEYFYNLDHEIEHILQELSL